MQTAEVVLGVLRERGRKGLPCTQLYRQMFNRELYLSAYGKIYSNQGAMTPGVGRETADGMSEEKIDQIIEAMRHEYLFIFSFFNEFLLLGGVGVRAMMVGGGGR